MKPSRAILGDVKCARVHSSELQLACHGIVHSLAIAHGDVALLKFDVSSALPQNLLSDVKLP